VFSTDSAATATLTGRRNTAPVASAPYPRPAVPTPASEALPSRILSCGMSLMNFEKHCLPNWVPDGRHGAHSCRHRSGRSRARVVRPRLQQAPWAQHVSGGQGRRLHPPRSPFSLVFGPLALRKRQHRELPRQQEPRLGICVGLASARLRMPRTRRP